MSVISRIDEMVAAAREWRWDAVQGIRMSYTAYMDLRNELDDMSCTRLEGAPVAVLGLPIVLDATLSDGKIAVLRDDDEPTARPFRLPKTQLSKE